MRLRCYAMSSKVAKNGAEEGTRTPQPFRVHGPEPCASANSATSASDWVAEPLCRLLSAKNYSFYSTDALVSVKPPVSATLAWHSTVKTVVTEFLDKAS